jgi:hypothetical protein
MTPALLTPLMVLLWAAPGGDATGSAAARFDEARRLFDGGQYPEAAEMFTELQAQTGDAALLYPAAQSLRLAGRCAEALAAYQRFVGAGDELRARAEAAPAGSGVKRLSTDLVYAGGRIVEMRACAARPRTAAAREEAQRRTAGGDAAAALAVMTPVWEETRDPTLLPELAELHRTLGNCHQAEELLDRAVTALVPVEGLQDAGPPGSDLAAAGEALRRARTAKLEAKCVPRARPDERAALAPIQTPTPPPPPLVTQAGSESTQSTARPRWPLWTAGVGGALVAAGVTSLILANRTEGKLEERVGAYGHGDPEVENLYEEGATYNRWGRGLTVAGAVVTVAALVYYYAFRKRAGPTAGDRAGITQIPPVRR